MQDNFASEIPSTAKPVQAIILPPYPDSAALSKGVEAALKVVRYYWWVLAIAGFLGAVAFTAVSHLLPRVYRAEAVLTPTQGGGSSGGLGSLLSRYGGIAAAIGMDVSAAATQTNEAIATMRSRTFIEQFISERKLLPVLFPDQPSKSAQDAYQLFVRDMFTVQQDKSTHLVTVAIEWTDREQAADWVNDLVSRINDVMRQRAIQISDANLHYLREEWNRSQFTSLRDTASSLMEAQLNSRMMAATQPDYAFRVIDLASPPDANKSVRPKRIVFALLGAMIGGLVSFVLCSMRLSRD